MNTVSIAQWFRRADAAEYALCLNLNRGCALPVLRHFFSVISRLGDGWFWYGLILLLPLVYGRVAVLPAARMAVVGVAGVALYKYLKSRLVRERPYISLIGIVAGTAPLDRYSFPSGHTLHATSFTILACSSFSELSWLLIPFATLVATSRVVLGLHYPTDVVAGALIGMVLALASMAFAPI